MTGERGRIFVTIEDSGSGISQADLPHIFERFYRAGAGDKDTEDKEKISEGYGIGLALADNIARVHGATLRCEHARRVFRVSGSLRGPASANLQIAAIS